MLSFVYMDDAAQTISSAQSFDPAQDASVTPSSANPASEPIVSPATATPPVQDDVAAQPAPVAPPPVVPMPPAPAAPPAKELEPTSSAPLEMPDLMQPTELEPVLHPEVAEAGVEAVSQHPTLTIEDHRAGLQPAGDSIPHHTQPNGTVKLPMTPEEAVAAAKNEPVENSKKWLGELIIKHLKTIHQKITGGGENNAA